MTSGRVTGAAGRTVRRPRGTPPAGDGAYRTIREVLFERIRSLILSGQYRSGTKLREEELARQFGVSRTPVREALRKLESEGLVRYLPQRGVLVNGLSDREMLEIYTIRASLEGLAARLAATERTEEEVRELRELQRQMNDAYARANWNRAARIHTRFNMALYAASRSPRLVGILAQFNDYIEHSKTRSLALPGRAQEIGREHQAMVDAIARKDPDEAERAAIRHVHNARQAFFHGARQPAGAAAGDG
ncbi:MAG: GntR family transcriptional regulator [Armatimonadota bacterium]|nr:GntR family transcriptional regulator [Armatimonadota bacterium]MDR7421425.1 GntR family transcriptional regulator [Armatimonadota bacterium]MDR7455080.1 GntR family transcriptional regulator [Armatimonadota bacterium]MDR7456087.1 GntR family transcriptional regulator [Armatimonadota bacterium]MDR7495351.1 GntR family transcriptional regulator [Armatimonadota bacterium]